MKNKDKRSSPKKAHTIFSFLKRLGPARPEDSLFHWEQIEGYRLLEPQQIQRGRGFQPRSSTVLLLPICSERSRSYVTHL